MSAALVERDIRSDQEFSKSDMDVALRLVRDERILPKPTALYSTGELMGRMNRVYVKDETDDPTGAFKLRGAWVRMNQLSLKERRAGVVTASAGNHAQGVAMAARLLRVHADIFLPANAPECKRRQTKHIGGDMVTLHEVGDASFDDALEAAFLHCGQFGSTFIHPFDDRHVIMGNGTIGSEAVDQLSVQKIPGYVSGCEDPSRATHFVPGGGGGLALGYSMAVKGRYPESRVVVVQLEGADSLVRSQALGERVALERPDTLSDGTAVRTVGHLPHRYLAQYVDEFITVTPAELGKAYVEELNRRSTLDVFGGSYDAYEGMPETAGMLSRAGALKCAAYDDQANAPWVLVQTGRNVDWSKVEKAVDAYQSTTVDIRRRAIGCGAIAASFSKNL